MFAQLGSIIFEGVFSPSTFDVDGDEAIYGEFPLLNNKPRLQKTGDSLQEFNLEIKFHAEFCNPAEQVEMLRTAKVAGEILPLLLGNGKYVADYVIVTMPYHINETFSDGTAKQITISLQLKEYIAYNKLEQKEQDARRKAFAVGDKKPIISRPPQPVNEDNAIARNITESKQQAKLVDDSIGDFLNNFSNRGISAKSIQNACKNGVEAISRVNKQLDDAKELKNKVTGLKSIALSVKDAFNSVKDLYPFPNINDLRTSGTYLQGVMRTFNRTATPLFQSIIVRK